MRDAFDHLSSTAIPERLSLGSVQLTGMVNGKYLVVSYSQFDPLAMPEKLAGALRFWKISCSILIGQNGPSYQHGSLCKERITKPIDFTL